MSLHRFITVCVPRALAALCLWLLGAVSAHAVTVNDLYEAMVRVNDRSVAVRNQAFNQALAVVLTKVSGRGDAPARVGAAAANAERYVQRYSYLATGQLSVAFDGAAVNELLEKAGLPLWDRDRPNTLVVYPLALQGLREAAMATEQTAKLRGVPVVWASGIASEQLPNDAQQLQALARRYDAVAVLLARPGAGQASVANLRWQIAFNGGVQELLGSPEEGPKLAAEVLSRYYAAMSKELVRVSVAVSGVQDLQAYANTISYLSGLLMVRAVAVESLQRDELRLRVELRGNADVLRRAIAVDRRLQEQRDPAAAINAAPDAATLTYRYNN